MANYTDDRDLLVTTIHDILMREALHGVLAQKVAVELGVILEPLIQQKVREALSKMTVKF